MRGSLFICLILMGIGLLGAMTNLYMGFDLTKDMESASDQHLSIALTSLFFIVAGGIGLIRFSRVYIESFEKDVLTPDVISEHSKITPLQKFKQLQEQRQRATTLVIISMVILLLSMISGTISQAGRFPLVHGVLGISLTVTLIASIYRWISLLRA